MGLLKDPKRFSKLLASVGVLIQHNRPLAPIEVAMEIEELKNEIGGSYSEVAERLSVSQKQILDFVKLLKLPPQIQGIFGYGRVTPGRIPFTTGARISALDDEKDMMTLANSVLDKEDVVISRDDVVQIVEFKKRNQDKTIEECIQQVLNIKPRVTNSYLVISDIKQSIVENLEKKAAIQNKELNEFAQMVFEKSFPPNSIDEFIIKDKKYAKVALTEEGYRKFHSFRSSSMRLNDIVNHIFQSEGY